MADLKDVWRHWKCIIKSTYFAPHQNDDEALKKVPTDRIVAEEWPLLVQYWKDKKVKDIARRNTNNSIKRKFPHKTGRKPFTALMDEIKATGKEPDNLEIWSSRTNGRGGDYEMTDDILVCKPISPFVEWNEPWRLVRLCTAVHSGGKGIEKQLLIVLPALPTPRSHLTGGPDGPDLRKLAEDYQKGLVEIREFMSEFRSVRAEMSEIRTICAVMSALLNSSPRASIRGLCSSRTDGRSETPGTDVLTPLTIGSRILLISRGLKKRVVGEGVLLSDPTPGDTVDIVRVFVTSATIPEAALILWTTSGAQTLGEVVRAEPIDWTFKDLVRRP
ncbi:uncharacterized protein LOC127257358 isoform X2 [Andrographis paniculata]|nr:uncharacterized protein LOC127257358 isoform X2 [Andrographis paniculata]